MAEPTRLSPFAIARLALGVRYEPQFRVFDFLGGLIDTVLRTENSPFGPKAFPSTETDGNERILVNNDTGNLLRVNQTESLLVWHFDATRNMDELFSLAKAFDNIVLSPLRDEVGIANVGRYGLVLRLSPITNVKVRPMEHYLAEDFPGGNLTTMAMRFTRRLPTTEAMWRKDVTDYRQVIYTVEEAESGTTAVSVDYQEYFRPALDKADWTKRPFSSFSDSAIEFFEGDVTKWLKRFTDSPVVAA